MHLVAQAHRFQAAECLTYRLAPLRSYKEHQEAAAAGAAQLAAFGSRRHGSIIVAIDLRCGDLRAEPPLELPAFMEKPAQAFYIDLGATEQLPELVRLAAHLYENIQVCGCSALLFEQHGGSGPLMACPEHQNVAEQMGNRPVHHLLRLDHDASRVAEPNRLRPPNAAAYWSCLPIGSFSTSISI